MRILRFAVGIILIPVCFAATRTMVSLLLAITPSRADLVPVPALAFGGGLMLWLLIYFILPLPMRTYVLAHELTHALWGAMMGARIVRMRVSKQSGSVTLSKSNFLITLAPYFFPLYTVIVIAAYYILSVFTEVEQYYLWWLGLVGFTWGFHATFTVSSLFQHQSDIKECGRIFSYSVIYLLNVAGICLWIVAVSAATLEQTARFFCSDTAETAVALWNWGLRLVERTRQ